MFIPVVTKDMQLFQTRQPLARLKNVRSRAQSLGTNLNSSISNGSAKVHVSTNCIVTPTNRASSQRNSQSVGALPTSAQLAFASTSLNSRSPPKSGSLRKPLESIAEGVPFRCVKKKNETNASAKPSFSFTANTLQSTVRKKIDDTNGNNIDENEGLFLIIKICLYFNIIKF